MGGIESPKGLLNGTQTPIHLAPRKEGPGSNPLQWRAGFVEGDYLYGIASQKEPWAASLSADFCVKDLGKSLVHRPSQMLHVWKSWTTFGLNLCQ